MGSELIVLSSDDEDDVLVASQPAKSHKRSKVLDADNDVTVIEKVSCLESSTIEKSSLLFLSLTEGKPLRDDDCCILNYDPENNVHVPDFQANDADDLVVVGERGPVACRDFPHARHLCVKFPFTTTSHEKYCEQCHCYVCDVIAPCLLWGQGKQSSDHCHAFDKDEKWKKMRSHARSVVTKLAAPIRRGQMIQPQLRTYTQPPLRVRLTTGVKSSANMNANVSSVNQYWSSLPGNWVPYMPSKMDTMLNGSYGNRASVGGTNIPCVGNSYIDSNVVPPANNRRRSFSEHNSAVSNNAPTTATSCALQQMSYQPPLKPVPSHGSIRITQTCTPRQEAMHNPPALQAATCTNFINTPGQEYQEQGVVAPALVPCNYVEGLGRTTQRIPSRPRASTCSKFGKDLATLQAYLMEGITGQSQGQSTAHGMSTAEAGCIQASVCGSGDSVSKGPSEMSLNRESERLYNPFEPSEMPLCNSVGVGIMPHQTANTQASVQISKNNESMPEPVAVNKDIPGKPLCLGGETDTASSLDQLLADFDDDFWMLLEPTFSGF